MKSFLLMFCLYFTNPINAQDKQATAIPAGKYETVFKNNQEKWEKGDIIILDGHQYKISTCNEIGEYRFSVSAQRLFFTSGPLKTVFAKTTFSNNKPAIIL
ncbi:MAG: hypothetical protein ACXWC7_18795, partial [Chitinophagaceae bacterium]